MASQVTTDTIAAPGFNGINTQDSSVALNNGYAIEAYNCVIDKYGRIGSRRGITKLTADSAALGSHDIESLGEFIDVAGTSTTFACGNNKIFKVTSSLTEITYGGGGTAPTISANNWKQVSLGGHHYFFQSGHEPLVYDPAVSTTTYTRISEHSGYTGSVDHCGEALQAYGRLWIADHSTNKSMVMFSDLMSGIKWSGGSSGYLDVTTAWANGVDTVTALAGFNGFLVIFGKRQILIYEGASDPTTMKLVDTIKGTGCTARDSIQVTKNDVIFLSEVGVMSLQRLLLEKSAPMRDISKNVRDELVTNAASEDPKHIKSVYFARDAFYLLVLPSTGYVYCFDMRAQLQDNTNRVTVWTQINPVCLLSHTDGRLLIGKTGYVGRYWGFSDNGSSYRMSYKTNYIDLQQPTRVKVLKKVLFVVISPFNQPITAKWAFDYKDNYNSASIKITGGTVYEYNSAEYNIAEFNSGVVLDKVSFNVGGAGVVVQMVFETEIDGNPVSLQRLDMFAKLGKVAY